METTALANGLIELARRQAERPEGRAQVIAALRETLAAIGGRCSSCCTADTEAGIGTAIVGLIDQLSCATEHAEFLREVITPPAPPRPRRGDAPGRSCRR